MISSYLAQYLLSKDKTVVCADTDPVNATFTQYTGLNVAYVELSDESKTRIIQKKFDPLIEKIAETDADFVIDNGSSTFMSLTHYMAENDIINLLTDAGKKIYIHNVLVAGQAKSDTLNGFEEVTKRINGSAKIVVWENWHYGDLDYNGHPFTKLKLYTSNASKIAGIVKLPNRTESDAFMSDLKQMQEKHMLFSEVLASPDFGLVAKSRMRKVMSEVFAELDKVEW